MRLVGIGSLTSITDNSLTRVLRCWTKSFFVLVTTRCVASVIEFFDFSVEGSLLIGMSLTMFFSNSPTLLLVLEMCCCDDSSFKDVFNLSLDETRSSVNLQRLLSCVLQEIH